jgi:cytochrome c peroxidase
MTRMLWVLTLSTLGLTGVFVARSQQPDQCHGVSCEAAARGLRAFSDPAPHHLRGNGRACADCHMPSDHFQLSPSTVEARYLYWQLRRQFDPTADDALFRPIDANDFREKGAQAEDYSNLRELALIRITFSLPANVKLVNTGTEDVTEESTVDVWRAVPSVQNVALTGPDGQNPTARGPNNAGGYQRDARFGSLQEQARAAFQSHMEFTDEPPPALLEDLAAFEQTVFSSPRVSALADGIRQGMVPLPNADPPLTELETQGKAVFARACAHCHGGPGMSMTPLPVVVRYHNTNTSCPRPVDTANPPRFAYAQCPPQLEKNVRTYEFSTSAGQKIRRSSDDPGRVLLTGFVGGPPPTDDWNKFDVPGLRGIRYTAPYFHNHSAATLEEVVDHYIAFFNFVRAQQPPGVFPPVASTNGVSFDRQIQPEDRAALIAYLKRL